MKKPLTIYKIIFLTFIYIFICVTFLSSNLATALCKESDAVANKNYYRVIDRQTIFYLDSEGESPLFYLPYTYYVKVVGENENFFHVECFGTSEVALLDGFVKKDKLFLDNLTVVSPYLDYTIKTLSTTNATLYLNHDLNSPIQYIFADREIKYYGEWQTISNEKLFYVGYNNKLGYVKESEILPFVIPNHHNELTFLAPELAPQDKENLKEKDNLTSLRICIIICLLFAGAIALFYVIKHKPKKEVAVSYYDENDYE